MIPERRDSLSRALAPALAMLCLLGWGAPCAASGRGGAAGTWAQAFEPGTVPSFAFFKENPAGLVFAASVLGPAGSTSPAILQEDSAGTILWQKVYGSWGEGQGFIEQGQGDGYLIGGLAGAPDRPLLWLASLDGAGVIQWQETVSAPPYRGFVDYAFPTKEGWLLRGMVINPLFQSQTPALVKLSPSGDIEWQWTYKDTASPGGGGDQYAITEVVPLDDGGAAAVGTVLSESSGDTNIFIVRIGADGRIVWQLMFGGADDEMPASLARADDGGFLLTGTVLHRGVPTPDEDSNSAWVIRLSGKGDVAWQTLLQAAGNGLTPSFGTVDPAGGYLVTGSTAAFGAGDVDAWAVKLDETGSVAWQRAYGGPGPDWASVVPDPAGGYLLEGVSASDAQGPSDFWLAKLDGNGGILWQEFMGGTADDWASAARLSDGRILVSGLSPPAFGPETRAWTMVLAPDGGFGQPCAWGRAATLGSQAGAASAAPLQSQPMKMNMAEYAASFFLAPSSATASDGTLVPADLCPPPDPLTATAEADVTSGTAPLSVQFTGSASGGAGGYAFAWDFGDGGSSAEQSPSHTYGSAGDYAVTLTVTDSLSQTAADGHLAIHVAPPAALAATASADLTSGNAPLTVQFTGAASGGTPPYAYSWAFGDGGTSGEQNPTHAYTTAGTFSALLTVTDGASHTASAAPLTVTVYGPLTVLASADPASGPAPLAVQFTGSASGGSGAYTYAWAFGDGGTSSAQSPSHTYAAAGNYAVTLTVTDSASRTAADGHLTIRVTAPVPPPVISLIKKVAPPFTLVVTGSNFQSSIRVFINGTEWTNVQWKNAGKVKILGGKSLKAAVPKGVPTTFTFLNPDGGTATVSGWSW